MSFNLAELFERVVSVAGDRTAVHTPARRLSYAELDDRADRLAHHLRAAGIGRGDHVGLQLLNGTEYIEGMLAAFKLSAVPVNINYRYVAAELQHLYQDADLVALIVSRQFCPIVDEARAAAPTLRHVLVVDHGSDVKPCAGSVEYEAALAAARSGREWLERSGDDLYICYTGGTTGQPKGVVWRHEDLFFGALGGGDPFVDKGPIGAPDELPSRVPAFPLVYLCVPPLMHVSAHWAAFNAFFGGGTVVLGSPGRFDPEELWSLVAEQRVNTVILVGDAMARPLLDRLADAGGDLDPSSLFAIGSGGAILSPGTKARIADLLPNVIIVDTFGSSETGVAGARTGDARTFAVDDRTVVVDEDLHPIEPGSGRVGRLARRGYVPLCYHKDPAKTAATFVEMDGGRWVMPGDMATVAVDGTIELLGRGSGCINTGGEKVYPEEVEAVIKGLAAVEDVLVVGLPDERWGARVVAVVQLRPDADADLESVQTHVRQHLAGYKVPRELHIVDEVRRGPNGKPDYGWAEARARDGVA